jgi:hypothetical protein
MKCLECEKELKGRQTKFCSYKCMNVYNARIFRKQHKEENPHRWRVCDVCGEEKNLSAFSLLDKTRVTTKEHKTTCKRCSKNAREKVIRNRTWKDDAVSVLWKLGRHRAKKAGLEWTIKKEHIIIPDFCPVLGIPLFREERGTWMNAPSLDRINNDLGYVPGNVMVISRRANIIKRDATLDELITIGKFYNRFLTEGYSGVIMNGDAKDH